MVLAKLFTTASLPGAAGLSCGSREYMQVSLHAELARHLEDTRRAVWRHVMFIVCWFFLLLEHLATVGIHWVQGIP